MWILIDWSDVMTLKEKFTYGVLLFDLLLFVAWPFLVFFHFILLGLALLLISSIVGVILYEIFKAATFVEHKVVHQKPKTN